MRYLWLLAIVFVAGCTEMPANYAPKHEQIASSLQKHTEKVSGVKHAHIYIVEPYIVVAMDVSPLKRYRKSKIESTVTSYVEQKYPEFEVIASADRKLQFELSKMSFNQSSEMMERLKSLQTLLKEET